uniref:Transposable element Tc3 transposase n=1 Tax=Anoplophora glabripennis TaxID=217634 RepID=V5GPN0_ANOGL
MMKIQMQQLCDIHNTKLKSIHFLNNDFVEILEDLDLETRRNMWLMQDGAPPHYSRQVRRHLNNIFANRWIGRGWDAPQPWPPRSPDLTPLDFFVWGYAKSKVYEIPIEDEDHLRQRITDTFNEIKTNEEVLNKLPFHFLKRVRACIRANGDHFQHMLK